MAYPMMQMMPPPPSGGSGGLIIGGLAMVGACVVGGYFLYNWIQNNTKTYDQATVGYAPTNLDEGMPCAGHPDLINKDDTRFCIVQRVKAPSVCKSISGCVGFATTTDTGWTKLFPDGAQLVNSANLKKRTNTGQWTTYLSAKPVYQD